MRSLRLLSAGLLLLVPALVLAEDPISKLKERMAKGEVRLEFDAKYGYLPSLLKSLKVPVSSQTLVFSKTSLQSEGISPSTPRALYFNDDIYAAWVQGAPGIEIMAVDSQKGAVFYFLGQENDGRPEFERVTGHICSSCHFVQGLKTFVPRVLFSSVIPDATGNVEGTFPFQTTDQSPMIERWGGWYVTGTHGAQRHLGNVFLKTPASPIGNLPQIDYSKSSNVTSLSSRFDTSRYLSPHSDIVALMVFAHQAEVHNLIALAAAKPDVAPQETGEPLLKTMLFAGAEPLKEPIKGTASFAAEFAALGPRDSRGRSLRDFDLNTRLFRYPLSYLIYSEAFDGIPPNLKTYVYRRLVEVLSGKDTSRDFAHISRADRATILEILRETKSDFPK
jgi:hypothetical protein